jgi:hypothetical protein
MEQERKEAAVMDEIGTQLAIRNGLSETPGFASSQGATL